MAVIEAEAVQQNLPAQDPTLVLMRMIERLGADPTFDPDRLQKLLDVHERWEAGEARKAFTSAMAEFKRNPPKIIKDTHVHWSKDGKTVDYKHASLGNVCDAVIEGLARVGISHHWEPEQKEGIVYVTCVLTHERGHSTRTQLFCAPDTSGSKNAIQALSSATTYLSRYTLLLATGLGTNDDDDGRATGAQVGSAPQKFITESQATDLQAKIEEVGANMAQFLKVLKVERLEDLPVAKFSGAIQRLNDRARGVSR